MTRDEELSALCLACGACCDGTLFSHVDLEPDELPIARKHRLRLIRDDRAFAQPCAAHVGGRCTAYAERPRACRAYGCRLLDEHARDGGALAPRLATIARIRELAARMRAMLPPSDAEESLWERVARAVPDGASGLREGDPTFALDLAELAIRLRRDLGGRAEPRPGDHETTQLSRDPR